MLASLKDGGQLMHTNFAFKEVSQESRFPALGGCKRVQGLQCAEARMGTGA